MRNEYDIRKDIEQTEQEIREITFPLKTHLSVLQSELAAAITERRGKIERCDNCYADIYYDTPAKYWRGIHSEDACCVGNNYHIPNAKQHGKRYEHLEKLNEELREARIKERDSWRV